jgi:hypothetical protein
VTAVRGHWAFGTNLEEFNALVSAGATDEEAAAGTWTGRRVAKYGFTKVASVSAEGEPGAYKPVEALFVRP